MKTAHRLLLLGALSMTTFPALAFSLDSGMIGQIAPLLLQYFGQQGVQGTVLHRQGGLWGVSGA